MAGVTGGGSGCTILRCGRFDWTGSGLRMGVAGMADSWMRSCGKLSALHVAIRMVREIASRSVQWLRGPHTKANAERIAVAHTTDGVA